MTENEVHQLIGQHEALRARYQHFMKLVGDMRAAQVLYFKRRDPNQLIVSKAKEKQVDEFLNPAPKPQASFFSDEFLGQ